MMELLSSCSLVRLSSPSKLQILEIFLKLNDNHSISLKGIVLRFSSMEAASVPESCDQVTTEL